MSKGKRWCKGPEVDTGLMNLRTSQEVKAAGEDYAMEGFMEYRI